MSKVRASNHRDNRLLAALQTDDFTCLQPHLEVVHLKRRQVLYETGDTIRYAYFPHDTVISLVAVMEDGSAAEMSLYGPEGGVGLIAAGVARQSLGRYMFNSPGRLPGSTSTPWTR
jgi:CRP-like cAMP-binding protein